MTRWLTSFLILLAALSPLPAAAQEPLYSYALLVGSNRGGPGQHTLAYAEDDAERVGALLIELARTPAERIRMLASPTPAALRRALAELGAQLAVHTARGERTQLVFYYSGHARAHALSFGDEELSLAELRASLTALSSTLTVVVLDACQSGAFSGVKGARAAEDFSEVSVSALRSAGLAVMASSSGAELSQESQELGAGYFTHHLLVGLRGAGDVDGDARVSLDEAYRYAYTQTLSSTARTRVGMQHATLETSLSGRGDVPLTYTADADAQLVLAKETSGRLLVQLPGRGSVMAELVKARGAELTLALPSGRYDVLVREEGSRRALSCHVLLPTGQRVPLVEAGCQSVLLDDDTHKKHGGAEPHETWFAELGISYGQQVADSYVRSLENFGYTGGAAWESAWREQLRLLNVDFAGGYGVSESWVLLARFDGLERRAFWRNGSAPGGLFGGGEDSFAFRTQAVSLGARLRHAYFQEKLVPYAELAVGLGWGRSVFDHQDIHYVERSYAPAVRGALGLSVGGRRFVGAYLSGGFVYAPVSRDEIGHHHNDGGAFVELGIRFRGHKRAVK